MYAMVMVVKAMYALLTVAGQKIFAILRIAVVELVQRARHKNKAIAYF